MYVVKCIQGVVKICEYNFKFSLFRLKMDLFNFEDRLKDEFEHDQGDNFVQNYVGVLNTPPHPPYDDTDEYLNYVDGGDKLEKISVSEENKTVFMSELTEFGFKHTSSTLQVKLVCRIVFALLLRHEV